MKVYLKIHQKWESEIIACCDEDLLNSVLKEDNLRLDVSENFFGGNILELEEAIDFLRSSSNFNIVGPNIIEKAIEGGIILEEGIKYINEIPIAMKMIF